MKSNTRIGDIAEVIMGQSPNGEDVNDTGDGIPLLNGPTEFTVRYPKPVQFTTEGRKFSDVGDILFCVRGSTTGRMNYADCEYAIGRGLAAIRGKNGYPTPYIRAIIESNLGKLLSSATGSTFPNVGRELLLNSEVFALSQEEAIRINDLIISFDDKITLNTQTNQTLEAIAQAIFKSWFVDFDPVKAKMAVLEAGGTAEDAERAAMCAISGKDETALVQMQREKPEVYAELVKTAALFPDAMQESELGVIPEGWEVGKLENLLEFNPKRSLKKGTLAPYLDMKNVPTIGHLADEVILREMNSGTKFINGDTLLARITPCLENGKTAFVDFLEPGQVGWGSTEYIVIRPINNIPVCFGYIIARLESFRNAAIQSMTGTSGRQRANEKALANLQWLQYPIELIKAFDKVGGAYLRQARINGDENKTLKSLRDTLLPKLLSGEIDLSTVPQTEEVMA